ncbi:hypothetical protein [Naumannella halotolerans]|uniref:Uncharacterized protein n=1 Tax=Naumannella halotolerans TaxID=993414 RepID=A0A4R7J323_9ACTN|nr:hypothetical protein [Naumannella halotolerans]TDT30886.1 hypothetical protein CLV29_2293 [Naumannella halotolerans]
MHIPEPENVPGDIVGHTDGCTREHYMYLNNRVNTIGPITIAGQPVYGPDGEWLGMTPNRTEPCHYGTSFVTRAQLEKVGLTAADVPNLRVIDTTGRTPSND